MEKTYFISFEGIDGSGKDTQLLELVKAIKEDKKIPFGDKYSNIWITREPTKITESGNTISNLIREREVGKEEATKYLIQDRIEHSKIIKETLKHSHVLSSRYDFSTLTYQTAQGMDFEKLIELHNYGSENGAIIPDFTIIFDLPVEIAIERISKRGEKVESFEKEEFQKKVFECQKICIEKLKDKRKIIIVNANQEIEKVSKEMIEKLHQEIKKQTKT